MTHLTPNFTLEELTHTDHREFENTPTEHERCQLVKNGPYVEINAVANLPRLADFLEQVKMMLGNKPIIVNSAFRSHDVNTAVGSADHSDHRRGCAADIRVVGMTPDEVTRVIIASDLPYQQVIREFDRWTHVSIVTYEGDVPAKSKLIIDKAGTRLFA
jgi:zinc D-Ala-D-Ala carboxypeptidase